MNATVVDAGEVIPQVGPQRKFLATSADIAIYGGAAGGGKTWALLMEPVRHISNKNFGAIIFRRTSVQIRNEGALWDESVRLYPLIGGRPRAYDLTWLFPSGSTISFAHLEHDKNVHDYQGAQIPLICFDELTHFSAAQFWYMVSRNRSMCGVKPYIRATCNPDVDSWVAQFISWWINQDTGYPIPERAGKVRWFVRVGEKLIWADEPGELAGYVNPLDGASIPPKSVTFIPSRLSDNKLLMAADPGYLANLLALPLVERERLLGGNWKIRWQGQTFFSMDSLLVQGQPVDLPFKCDSVFGVIDSATKTGKGNDGTAVTFFARTKFGAGAIPLVVLDWDIVQIEGALLEHWLPSVFTNGEDLARRCHARNGFVGIWIEDAASGMILLQQAKRRNQKVYAIDSKLTSLGKEERALSVSGYVYTGQVKICESAYHKTVIYKDVSRNHLVYQLENFSIGAEDANKRPDDLLDCFCYGIALALGDKQGF